MKKYLLIICILLLTSCTRQQIPLGSKMPGIDLTLDQMNKEIKLEPTTGMMDTFEFDGVLELDLENISDQSIVFPSDFGVKIFMKQGVDWIPIKNRFEYSDSTMILPPQKDYSFGPIVDVLPLLPSPSTSGTTIRIVVIGNVQGTGKAVGAYIDIDLSQ